KFRQDLYYRINVIRLSLPPLRHRMEDIPILVDKFIQKLNVRQGKFIQGIDKKVLHGLMSHEFPGNIRELENLIEHAFVLCSEGYIKLNHLPGFLSVTTDINGTEDKSHNHEYNINDNSDPVKSAQIKLIVEALARNKNNKTAAAKDLGIHKSTLFRRIKKLEINL
ncbi:MAG: Fis family transcriptional regulator, partial [Desulfobacula sp.]|nr:Fis family transcriptional regulator [Desulfobacula sp.]